MTITPCYNIILYKIRLYKSKKKEHFYEKLKWFSTILIVILTGLCFAGKSKLSINKKQKIPYTVTPTATGGFEATINFFCFL